MTTGIRIQADPYLWPFDGPASPSTLAIIVIDMQVDFCGKGGYIDSQGIDLANTRRAIATILEANKSEHGIREAITKFRSYQTGGLASLFAAR